MSLKYKSSGSRICTYVSDLWRQRGTTPLFRVKILGLCYSLGTSFRSRVTTLHYPRYLYDSNQARTGIVHVKGGCPSPIRRWSLLYKDFLFLGISSQTSAIIVKRLKLNCLIPIIGFERIIFSLWRNCFYQTQLYRNKMQLMFRNIVSWIVAKSTHSSSDTSELFRSAPSVLCYF